MTLVIMAAGMGSRYGGLKQIEPIGPEKEFIIDYSIYDAIKAGFNKVVFIIKEENYDLFRQTVGKRIESKIQVEYAFQKLDDLPIKLDVLREKPWGTGQAILCAREYVKDNFAIINADDFYGHKCYEEMATFLRKAKDNEYAIIGYQVAKTMNDSGAVKRGVCESENGYLAHITESVIENKNGIIMASPLDGAEPFAVQPTTLVSMNAMCFTPTIFKYLEEEFSEFLKQKNLDVLKSEYLIPDVIKKLVKEKKVTVQLIETTATWHGITYKEDTPMLIEAIHKYINEGLYSNNLWQ